MTFQIPLLMILEINLHFYNRIKIYNKEEIDDKSVSFYFYFKRIVIFDKILIFFIKFH